MLFETKRLLVRKLRAEDADALFAVLSDPEVMKYIEPPFSREQTAAFIRDAGLCEPPLVYAVLWKASGALIGHLIWHAWENGAMELGWVLQRDFWGRGLARELTAAALAQTAQSLVIECAREQRATRHIAEAFGFRLMEETPEKLVWIKAR